ncbi:hypothetical protein BCR37DRAFT_388586 [Protomyces lactucae-debilis]|uniref:Uncharacterized protein n=1 Tax=Protomyces lactucae-debilis TaxID=2754530 RepID=A0A1Y2F5M9_PROLT|nr:uncharacterized protein BCR37DRAFT_388586 [Protomyces lactucae-debilis]ORY78957.1 hypothetical protein BCR37DRAFT_388586 [Protomyces lactucae-debilis]
MQALRASVLLLLLVFGAGSARGYYTNIEIGPVSEGVRITAFEATIVVDPTMLTLPWHNKFSLSVSLGPYFSNKIKDPKHPDSFLPFYVSISVQSEPCYNQDTAQPQWCLLYAGNNLVQIPWPSTELLTYKFNFVEFMHDWQQMGTFNLNDPFIHYQSKNNNAALIDRTSVIIMADGFREDGSTTDRNPMKLTDVTILLNQSDENFLKSNPCMPDFGCSTAEKQEDGKTWMIKELNLYDLKRARQLGYTK